MRFEWHDRVDADAKTKDDLPHLNLQSIAVLLGLPNPFIAP